MTSPGISFADPFLPATTTTTTTKTTAGLPRACLVVSSAHGVVEVERDGCRYVGVLDAPGATVLVGAALSLKILCRAENAYPYVVEDPQDLTVHVLAIDGAEMGGHCRLLQGVVLDVAVASSPMSSALAPPLPVVVGDSLDDALANAVLADTLEPDSHEERARAHDSEFEQDVITGSLRRLPLCELVQALSLAQKTAAIHVRVVGGSGVIYLDNGEVTCAQLDDDPRRAVVRGASAFHRLLAYDQGSFRVSFERAWHERNVHASTQMLLLEGLRLLDEARRDGVVPASDVHDEETEIDDADIEEVTFDLEELAVRPAMSAHLASPVVPVHDVRGRAAASFSARRRLPPVLSSVLVAPRSSTR